MTPDFQEALHEKIKPSQPERKKKKKNRFQWFLRSNHANEAVSFTLHSYHILQQKKETSVAETFPTIPCQMSLMLSISDIYHNFLSKSASTAIQSISKDIMIHLADSIIQSEQHCIEGTYPAFPGNRTHGAGVAIAQCSTVGVFS